MVVPHDSIPGDQGPSDAHDADDSELRGISSESLEDGDNYYQGTFRFFNPCPSDAGLGHHFYVEVYEKDGKYRRAAEKVMCEGPLRPGPTGLRFEVDSDVFGQGIASYNRAINSDSHTVLLVNAVDRTIVAERSNAGTAEIFTGLNNGWEYHLIVIAENRNGTYNADAITARVRWLGQSPAPQSPIGTPPAPTGRNILCQTGQYQVMSLLADCDLGMVTGLSAEAGADPGTVNLTWTAGANSTMHYVAGIKGVGRGRRGTTPTPFSERPRASRPTQWSGCPAVRSTPSPWFLAVRSTLERRSGTVLGLRSSTSRRTRWVRSARKRLRPEGVAVAKSQ